jgi:hypothetical protein
MEGDTVLVEKGAMAAVDQQVPKPLKVKLDAPRSQGYTASGYIRGILERQLNAVDTIARKGK